MVIVNNMDLFPDAAYYANWLSIAYGLKDRLLKNLLVFSSKIADLTFLTLFCLRTKGKREKSLSFALKSPFRKDKAYWWLFRRFGLQNGRQIHEYFSLLLQPKEKVDKYCSTLVQPSLFFPFFSFILMHVYMNTEIK